MFRFSIHPIFLYIWTFKVGFFVYLKMSIFQSTTGLNGLNEGIAFVQISNIAVFWKLKSISKKIDKKDHV